MILPKKEDTRPFADYSILDFQKWLKKGVKAYVTEGHLWEFEPVAVFMGQENLLYLDLRNFYEALPSKKCQKRFRAAVENLIFIEVDPPAVFVELFSLAKCLGIIKLKIKYRQEEK